MGVRASNFSLSWVFNGEMVLNTVYKKGINIFKENRQFAFIFALTEN